MNPPQPENSAPGGKRSAIIDLAGRRFAEHGFHAVSMRDIAKLNNSSVATLYNHFPSKDALMLEVGMRFFDPFLGQLREIVVTPQDGLTKILAMVDLSFVHGCAHRYEFLAVAQARRHIAATPALAPLVAARVEAMDLWERVLKQGMDDGSIRPDIDTISVVWVVLSALTGILDVNMEAEFADSDPSLPLSSLLVLLDGGLRPRQ